MTDHQVWIEYVVSQCILKNYIHWYDISTKGVDDSKCNIYPALGVKTTSTISKEVIKIKTFDEFCKGSDSRISECLEGRRCRLKQIM